MDEAVRLVLADSKVFLFGSMMGELVKLPELKEQLRDILIKGDVTSWLTDDEEQKHLDMYGFIHNENNTVKVSDKWFDLNA